VPPSGSPKATETPRLVVLGASNLTLGLAALLATARGTFGPEVEVLAALGYGRSYGAPSTIAIRTLPGILESGLWRELETRPRANTRALITDVGNDIAYGFPPGQILSWVKEAARRLLTHTEDVVLTDLPAASIRRLSPGAFLFFRTLFFPPCRLSRDEAFERVDQVNEGLAEIATSMGLRFVRLHNDWYRLDPIHMRPGVWPKAWREILSPDRATNGAAGFSALELARIHALPPERRRLLGLEQVTPQSGRKLRRGGRLWIY
jgi:hypothetical protein